MRQPLSSRTGPCRRASSAVLSRLALTTIAVALVAAADVAATLSAASPHVNGEPRATAPRKRVAPAPYGGEPHLSREPAAPIAVRQAAIRFVRDYALWSAAGLTAIPAGEATKRVIRLVERQDPRAAPDAGEAAWSVRIARHSARSFVVTSTVGNFVISKRRSRWLVASVPGD
jgi:hypothetical protein